MQQVKNFICCFVLILFLLLIACNEPSTSSENSNSDTTSAITKSNTVFMPDYDPALDPLTVGAAFSKKLYDTLDMKMFEVTLNPGDSIALHYHPDHAIYMLQGGKALVTIKGEAPAIFETKTGEGWITGPYTDQVKNIGNAPIRFVEVDVYRPRVK